MRITLNRNNKPRNPDYYCRRCGADEESGGEPAVCNECRNGDNGGNTVEFNFPFFG